MSYGFWLEIILKSQLCLSISTTTVLFSVNRVSSISFRINLQKPSL